MRPDGRDKRTDVSLLMREEIDRDDGPMVEAGNENKESDHDELAALIATHEDLRRQVALLRAQLEPRSERKTTETELRSDKMFEARVASLVIAALGFGMLAAMFLRKTTI